MPEFINRLACTACCKRIHIFSFLSEEELQYIDTNRHEVSFNAGEIIFKQGAPLTHIVCLTSGLAKIYIEGLHKKNLVLKILRPTEIAAGPGLFVDNKLHYSMMAIKESFACLIDIDAFMKIVEQNSAFAFELLRHLNQQTIGNMDRMVTITQKQMPGRLADALLYLSNKVYESNRFTLDLSRQDLADMSSMTKESAIRILKEFKDSGILRLEGHYLEILNKEKLVNISVTG
jgi:CRP-like cAMP-binding protein